MRKNINDWASLATIIALFISIFQIVLECRKKKHQPHNHQEEKMQEQKFEGNIIQNTGTLANYQINNLTTNTNITYNTIEKSDGEKQICDMWLEIIVFFVLSMVISFAYRWIVVLQILAVVLCIISTVTFQKNNCWNKIFSKKWEKYLYMLAVPVLSLCYDLNVRQSYIKDIIFALETFGAKNLNEYKQFIFNEFFPRSFFVIIMASWLCSWVLIVISQISILLEQRININNSLTKKVLSRVHKLWLSALCMGFGASMITLLFTKTLIK